MTEDIIVWNHISRHKLRDVGNPLKLLYDAIQSRELCLSEGVYYLKSTWFLDEYEVCDYVAQVFDEDINSWRLLTEEEIEPINTKLKSGVYPR